MELIEHAQQIREPLLHSLYIQIKHYKKMLKGIKAKGNMKFNGGDNRVNPFVAIADAINYARSFINLIELDDLLKEREEIKNKTYYEGTESLSLWYNKNTGEYKFRKEYSEEKEVQIERQCYLVPNGRGESTKINLFKMWKDEAIEFIKNPRAKKELHSKLIFFRIGNDFYRKSDYLLYDGKAYSRKKYDVHNGKLISLENNIIVHSKIPKDNYSPDFEFENKYILQPPKDEKFLCIDENEDAFLKIFMYPDVFSTRLFGNDFKQTLFKSGKNRIYTRNSSVLTLPKELCMDLDIHVSDSHKKVYNEIERDYIEAIREENVAYDLGKEMLRNRLMPSFTFSVELINEKAQGLLATMIRELFHNGDYITIDQLKLSLAGLRELLAEEKKYAKSK